MLIILLLICVVLYVLGEEFKSDIMESIGAVLGMVALVFTIAFSAYIISEGNTPTEQLQECQKVISELETLKESTITNYTQNIPEKELTAQEQEDWIQKFYSDIAIIERQINEKVNEADSIEQEIEALETIKFFVYFGDKQ